MNCFVLEGKMALPNQYFAGRLGSRFIIALRDRKKITGVRCEKCKKTFIPPREYCEQCWTKIADKLGGSGNEGELVNYTVVRYGDRHLPKKAPYILGQIKLDRRGHAADAYRRGRRSQGCARGHEREGGLRGKDDEYDHGSGSF